MTAALTRLIKIVETVSRHLDELAESNRTGGRRGTAAVCRHDAAELRSALMALMLEPAGDYENLITRQVASLGIIVDGENA